MSHDPVVMSDDEAVELYRFTRYAYISLNDYPALNRLLDRVADRVEAKQAAALDVKSDQIHFR